MVLASSPRSTLGYSFNEVQLRNGTTRADEADTQEVFVNDCQDADECWVGHERASARTPAHGNLKESHKRRMQDQYQTVETPKRSLKPKRSAGKETIAKWSAGS